MQFGAGAMIQNDVLMDDLTQYACMRKVRANMGR